MKKLKIISELVNELESMRRDLETSDMEAVDIFNHHFSFLLPVAIGKLFDNGYVRKPMTHEIELDD